MPPPFGLQDADFAGMSKVHHGLTIVSRDTKAAWAGVGAGIVIGGAALGLGAWRLGLPVMATGAFPILLFALYGAAWGVAFAVKRSSWMALIAAGCFAAVVACRLLIGTPAQWLVLALGLFMFVGVPGAMIVLQARRHRMGIEAVGFDVADLDEIIHGRIRLGIMVYLARAEAADFTELKAALQTTQGNLSIHLRKLEDAGYIAIDKSFLNRRPLTRARISKAGRKALAAYLAAMARLVNGDRKRADHS